MDENEKKELGQRIKSIRIELGKNMKEFGELFTPKASDSIVSRWERGISAPTPERLNRISEIGGVSVRFLLTGLPDDFEDFYDTFRELAETTIKENNKIMDEVFHQYLDFFLSLNDNGRSKLIEYAKYLATKEEYQAVEPDNVTIEIPGVTLPKRKKIDYTNSKNIVKFEFLNNISFEE